MQIKLNAEQGISVGDGLVLSDANGDITTQTITGRTLNSNITLTPSGSGKVSLGGGAIVATVGPTSGLQHTVPSVTSDTFALLAASQTLTNKTLTSPVIGTIVNTGTLTLPTSTDTLVGRATTDTLTNKTISTGSTWNGNAIGLAYGGTGAALADPNVDGIFFWDDSAGSSAFLTVGNSIVITGTTINTAQDIRTTASPSFAALTIPAGNMTTDYVVATNTNAGAQLYNSVITTGSVSIGNSLTSGAVNIANGTAQTTGVVNIASGNSARSTSTLFNLGNGAGTIAASGILTGNIMSGATIPASGTATRILNLGTGAGANLTTNINIGSTLGTTTLTSGTTIISGNQYVSGALNNTSGVFEHGRVDGIASTPFIDFHAGATVIDYDTRIIALSGNGVSGGGAFAYVANTHLLADAGQTKGLRVETGTGIVQSGAGATLATGSTDYLNIVSAGAAATRLRWYQNTISEWSFGMAASSNVMTLALGSGAGTAKMTVDTNGLLSATTFSGSGANLTSIPTAALNNSAVTYAKIQNVSATDRILGRYSAGAGGIEEITCTIFARTLLDDADAGTARTTMGAATLATSANWSTNNVIGQANGLLAWKHYGDNHVIFDASNSTSPAGGAVNNTNATTPWSSTYPTLMGWNGSSTYGVRVDSARYADGANMNLASNTLTGTAAQFNTACSDEDFVFTSNTQDLANKKVTGSTTNYASITSGNSTANGNFICRSSGTGNDGLAGMTFWNDTYALKMGVDNVGTFGIGGWSRGTWSWYSDSSGNMVAAGNVTAYSDPRLKNVSGKITNAVSLIEQLDGVHFTWKSGIPHIENKAGKKDVGVLADQVKKVLPEIITESIEIDGEKYDTVDYSKLVPVLIEAVKELSARIMVLENDA